MNVRSFHDSAFVDGSFDDGAEPATSDDLVAQLEKVPRHFPNVSADLHQRRLGRGSVLKHRAINMVRRTVVVESVVVDVSVGFDIDRS